jgi:hypothetical protein
MALLFIVVAAVVGFVIITAASGLSGRATSSGGVGRELADQRQYVLRSAARVLEHELVGDNGAYVCYQNVSADSNADSDAGTRVTSGFLAAGATPTFTVEDDDKNPDNVLEYLVWQATRSEQFHDVIAGPNQWTFVKVGENADGTDIFEYHRDILLSLSGTDVGSNKVIQAVRGSNSSRPDETLILCKLTADSNLNITAEIGFDSTWDDSSFMSTADSNDFAGETITFTLPATMQDLSVTHEADPASGSSESSSSTRVMYLWTSGGRR